MQTINQDTNLNEVTHAEYPVIIKYPLLDVKPKNPNALYKHTEIEDDDNDEYYDQFEIPTRSAFYQLIADTCLAIQQDLQQEHDCNGDYAPGDDGTEYVGEAICFLDFLREYDFI